MSRTSIPQLIQQGLEHHRAGRLDESEAIYRRVLQVHPNNADALNLLGAICFQRGNAIEAVRLVRQAILANPVFPDYRHNLAQILTAVGEMDAASAARGGSIAEDQQALAIDSSSQWLQLGNSYLAAGHFDRAAECYRRAIALDPNFEEAHDNLGTALRELGQFDESLAAHDRAIAIKSDSAPAHFNRSIVLLLKGDFERGFSDYESRWQTPDFTRLGRTFARPRWDGSELNGKRILLHAEQGFGDVIQFCRYAPLVRDRGGRVTLACQPELVPLMQTLNGVQDVTDQQWPDCDVHCPLMSLPFLFHTTLETIPASIPYLRADPARSAMWEQRLASDGSRKIGIAWSGRASHRYDRHRTIPLEALAPLMSMPGVHWISLQKWGATSAPEPIADVANDLKDFADTAALIDNLDAVVTIDTAVAHLAGAMGKPVFVLLPFVPDWRWMLDRPDSPWYPTMRLFRQPRAGNWEVPVIGVVEHLKTLL